MDQHSPLAAWQTFFFLVGSSAAGLTGLQFVVIALIAESKRRATGREIDAFTTPTIVHFAGVLLLSALVSAPWHGLLRVAVIIGVCGIAGIFYTLIIARRARSQTTYEVVASDWCWHVMLPLIAYITLVISAALLPGYAERVLFIIGATAMVLLFIGIHNAWDTVTYITVEHPQASGETDTPAGSQDRVADSAPATQNVASNTQHLPSNQSPNASSEEESNIES
ncbi:MAG TPA: hypothetical protein VGO56_13235 [Pyrinomonadaceae bacterium]|jgi:hypothetical protein|nr:hypothetical protein [Pyrinomonadaceae bacterium]